MLKVVRTQLIRRTIDNFYTAPDKTAVARVSESISTLQQARDLRLRDAESSLKSKFSIPTVSAPANLANEPCVQSLPDKSTHSHHSMPS